MGNAYVLYHASPVRGIKVLEPRISNHGVPLIYFSKKRENVLVYLSNAVEKYCKETGFAYRGPWKKWGPYGFNRTAHSASRSTTPMRWQTPTGVSPGTSTLRKPSQDSGFSLRIPDAAGSSQPVTVTRCEFIPDAYEAILAAEREGLITILRYEDSSPAQLEWNARTIREEYEAAADHPGLPPFYRGQVPYLRVKSWKFTLHTGYRTHNRPCRRIR